MLDKYSIFLANSTPSGMATTKLITSASMSLSMSLLYPHTLSLLSLYLHHRAGGEHSDHRRAVSGVLVGAEERETGRRDHCVCRELTPENHQESGETGWGESPHTISIQMAQTYFFLAKCLTNLPTAQIVTPFLLDDACHTLEQGGGGGGGGGLSTLKLFMPGNITSLHYYPVLYEHGIKGGCCGKLWSVCDCVVCVLICRTWLVRRRRVRRRRHWVTWWRKNWQPPRRPWKKQLAEYRSLPFSLSLMHSYMCIYGDGLSSLYTRKRTGQTFRTGSTNYNKLSKSLHEKKSNILRM